jgi:hypothetical protein
MATRKLTVNEVLEAMGDENSGQLNLTLSYDGPDGQIILERPQVVNEMDSISFKSGEHAIERFIGSDTEDENGEDVFQDFLVITQQPLQGGRKSRKCRKGRKSRKSRKSRKCRRSRRSRRY